MKQYQNEGSIDRMVRVIVAEVLFMSGYLWLSGGWQIAAYIVGAISLITAITGFCGAYKMAGISTYSEDKRSASCLVKGVFVAVLLIIAAIGIYYTNF